MKYYQYREIITNETVLEDESTDYALDKLGVIITPKGKQGEYTLEQTEFLQEFTDWYFSGNWIKEEVEDEDIPDLEEDLEKADRIYQENLERKWGIA